MICQKFSDQRADLGLLVCEEDYIFWSSIPQFNDELRILARNRFRIDVVAVLNVAEFVFNSMVKMRDAGSEIEFDFEKANASINRLKISAGI